MFAWQGKANNENVYNKQLSLKTSDFNVYQ